MKLNNDPTVYLALFLILTSSLAALPVSSEPRLSGSMANMPTRRTLGVCGRGDGENVEKVKELERNIRLLTPVKN